MATPMTSLNVVCRPHQAPPYNCADGQLLLVLALAPLLHQEGIAGPQKVTDWPPQHGSPPRSSLTAPSGAIADSTPECVFATLFSYLCFQPGSAAPQ